jgi:hypothetical protein
VNVDKTVDRTTVPLSASISNNTNLSSPERVPVSVTTEKLLPRMLPQQLLQTIALYFSMMVQKRF